MSVWSRMAGALGMGLKASPVGRVILQVITGQRAIWTPVDYASLTKKGYQQNVYVYASVNQVARSAAGIEWGLFRRGGRKWTEIEDHALLNLLAQPNPAQGRSAFIEAMAGFYLLNGNSYLTGAGPKAGPPKELYTLRPDRTKVLPGDALNIVRGYEYKAGSNAQTLDVDQVLHWKTWDPLNDWYGMSPLQAAMRSVDQSNESKAWNVALLQNSARPSGALVVRPARPEDPAELTDAQFERFKTQLKEQKQGVNGAGEVMVLEGGLTWQEMGLSPADMAWMEGQKLSAREIAMAFGVPPELIGDSANKTYANYAEARKALYTETVLPLMDSLRDELNRWLVPQFGDGLRLDYDRDDIEALQEDREKVWTRVKAADWLTVNEKRQATGYDEIPDGDIILVPAAMLPLSEATAPVEAMPAGKAVKAFNLPTPEAKQAHWKAIDRVRRSWEKSWKAKVAAQFAAEGAAVIAAYKAKGEGAALAALDAKAWSKTWAAMARATMDDFGERTLQGLKADGAAIEVKADVFDRWRARVDKFIADTVGSKITGVLETTKQRVKSAITDGVDAGEGIEGIASRIADTYAGFEGYRSELIARTETVGFSGAGNRYAALSTELPLKKEWIATNDSRTRDWHSELNGQTKGMDEAYDNGLLYPGDPGGDASEVCNCRCTEGYHVVRNEE